MLVRLLRAVLYICAGRAAAVLCYPTAAKQRCDSDSCSALGATAGKPRTHPSYWPSLSPLQQRHTQTMETHTHRGLYSCSCWIQYVCTHTHACTHTHTDTAVLLIHLHSALFSSACPFFSVSHSLSGRLQWFTTAFCIQLCFSDQLNTLTLHYHLYSLPSPLPLHLTPPHSGLTRVFLIPLSNQ